MFCCESVMNVFKLVYRTINVAAINIIVIICHKKKEANNVFSPFVYYAP